MCKYGTSKRVLVTIPSDLSYTGKERKAVKAIDSCIASLVKALEDGGIRMRASCCGHFKTDGRIDLEDGRILIIRSKEKTLRKTDEDDPHQPDKASEALLIKPLHIRLRLRKIWTRLFGSGFLNRDS